MKLSLKKLNEAGFDHLFLGMVIVAVVAIGGTYVLVKSHADPLTPSAATTTSKTFTMLAKNMYGDGLGPSLAVTEGTGSSAFAAQEIEKASKANVVYNIYDTSLSTPLNKWNKTNVGKTAKFCIMARSVGTSSRLTFNLNTGMPGSTFTLAKSSTYKAYCSSAFKITNPSAGGSVTVTIDMQKLSWTGTTVPPITGGPLRIKAALYELQ